MRADRPHNFIKLIGCVLLTLSGIAVPALHAQNVQFSKPNPTGAPTAPPSVLKEVGIDQKLENRVPTEIVMRDETGKEVTLGDYFNKSHRPILLTPVYYECPMLCTMTLNGITKALRPLQLNIGKDFDVITFSFDPTETPELAAKKKQTYLDFYKREGAEKGWHFLTGSEESIKRLTDAVGFRYTWDKATQQYAHASAVMILTPDGTVSKYFYGLEYGPRDVRLGLVEASEGKIGSLSDELLLLCFHYDPESGQYGPAVMRLMRIGGAVTLVAMGTFIGFMIRRDRRITAERLAGAQSPEGEASETATKSS